MANIPHWQSYVFICYLLPSSLSLVLSKRLLFFIVLLIAVLKFEKEIPLRAHMITVYWVYSDLSQSSIYYEVADLARSSQKFFNRLCLAYGYTGGRITLKVDKPVAALNSVSAYVESNSHSSLVSVEICTLGGDTFAPRRAPLESIHDSDSCLIGWRAESYIYETTFHTLTTT